MGGVQQQRVCRAVAVGQPDAGDKAGDNSSARGELLGLDTGGVESSEPVSSELTLRGTGRPALPTGRLLLAASSMTRSVLEREPCSVCDPTPGWRRAQTA